MKKKLTPKQRVLRRWRVHVSRDCGGYCIGNERLGVIGYANTEAAAWADAAKRIK